MRPPATPLDSLLADYARRHPEEDATVALFQARLARGGAAFGRDAGDGHFTGSALLVSRDGWRTLLTHHRKLGRWLQPGGHADGDADLPAVALREASEESGLPGLVVEPAILDLDRHAIPARGTEPEHFHYDVRFVVHATDCEAFSVSAESLALAWRDLAAVAEDPGAGESLQRLARKFLARQGAPQR